MHSNQHKRLGVCTSAWDTAECKGRSFGTNFEAPRHLCLRVGGATTSAMTGRPDKDHVEILESRFAGHASGQFQCQHQSVTC
jgi:hypothetical protein